MAVMIRLENWHDYEKKNIGLKKIFLVCLNNLPLKNLLIRFVTKIIKDMRNLLDDLSEINEDSSLTKFEAQTNAFIMAFGEISLGVCIGSIVLVLLCAVIF